MAEELRRRGLAAARIGADHRSYGFTAATRDRLGTLLPEARFVDLPAASDLLRAVKLPLEIGLIGEAAGIAEGHGGRRRAGAPRGSITRTPVGLRTICDLTVEPCGCRFIENETVPPDAEVVGHAWHKSNKDGSSDRRFAQNFQIPIALYGEIRFKTRNGVEEAYNASRCGSALAFGHAISNFQDALRRQVKSAKPAVGPAAASEGPQKDPGALLPALPKVLGAYETIAIPAQRCPRPLRSRQHPLPPPRQSRHPAIVPLCVDARWKSERDSQVASAIWRQSYGALLVHDHLLALGSRDWADSVEIGAGRHR
jgi:hypothetical protein